MCRDIERGEVNGVQIPGNKIEPQCPFLDTLPYEQQGMLVSMIVFTPYNYGGVEFRVTREKR